MIKQSSKTRSETKASKNYRERVTVTSKQKKTSFFSIGWVVASLFVYLVVQVGFSIVAQTFVTPHIVAAHTKYLTEGLIVMFGFYLGSFVLGVVSPGLRVLEPVIGACLAILASFSLIYFAPVSRFFADADLHRILIGCLIAGGCAAAGVYSGEKLMGNVG